MSNVWNFGNTTIRNPNRIEMGLKVFADEFQGAVHGSEAEAAFSRRLAEAKVINTEGSYSDLFGRKWRNVLVKLGFVTDIKYRLGKDKKCDYSQLPQMLPELSLKGMKYEIAPIGQRLIDARTTGEVYDVFLRQLLCYEVPSPRENKFPKGQMKPFVFLLQVLSEIEKASGIGLSKTEIGLFLQPFTNHNDKSVSDSISNILKYRSEREGVIGARNKKLYDNKVGKYVCQRCRVSFNTLIKDYPDTTFRYSQMTGLLTTNKGRLIIRPNKVEVVNKLLEKEPFFLASTEPVLYLKNFYSGVKLATDNIDFSLAQINELRKELISLGFSYDEIDAQVQGQDIGQVEQVRHRLSELSTVKKEEAFAINQAEDGSLLNIMDYLNALMKSRPSQSMEEIIDPPAYLEWAVWRGFLAIDHFVVPAHRTRGFPIDEDNHPRHPATAGKPDLVFEFDHYILVVEVTLTTSIRQLVAEGEPVRRHVANVQMETEKPVLGLFIAPKIDNNVAETYKLGTYFIGDESVNVNIVPITISEFRDMVDYYRRDKYHPDVFKRLLDHCLHNRNMPTPQWRDFINEQIKAWVKKEAS